jgi:hypothetical protein
MSFEGTKLASNEELEEREERSFCGYNSHSSPSDSLLAGMISQCCLLPRRRIS